MALANNPIGALFIGVFFAAILSGIATVQAGTFLTKSKHTSHLGIKIAVVILWLMDSLHMALAAHVVYYYLITEPLSNATSPPAMVWSMPSYLFLQLIIMPSTQWLYVQRISKLTPYHRRWIPMGLTLLVLWNFAIDIYIGVQQSTVKGITGMEKFTYQWAVYIMLSTTSVTDILITVVLIHALATSGSNLSWTDSSMTMLSAYVLNSGALVSTVSVVGLIAFGALPPFIYVGVEVTLARLYFNGIMGMLNAHLYLQTDNKGYNRTPTPTVLQSQDTPSLSTTSETDTTQHRTEPFTINEVGLPLFSRTGESKSEVQVNDLSTRAVEVMVQKEVNSLP